MGLQAWAVELELESLQNLNCELSQAISFNRWCELF